MKVLVVGGGGREHAICECLSRSKRVSKIYAAPGNAGIANLAECVDISVMDFEGLIDLVKKEGIDLSIIGMDDPLCAGIVDAFESEGLRVFGPRKAAAILEGSKAFSKELMKKYSIPTAEYECFDNYDKAAAYLESCKYPTVIKADGLALGKGVYICKDKKEAMEALKEIMVDKKHSTAGDKIVIEEFMEGREVSVLSFVDGKTIKIMSSAQDHKSPFYTKEVDEFCKKHIYQKTVDAMRESGREFKGIIFFGLILTKDGPKVLEYNARFGDPETQVVLPRLRSDLVDIVEACIDGKLENIDIDFEDNAAVCVVLASKGYPKAYEKGFVIEGLDAISKKEDVYCFHAGTKFKDGKIVTNGGRVLGISAKAKSIKEAREKAYKSTELIGFENKYMRTDIADI